jgi:hypothetical protein
MKPYEASSLLKRLEYSESWLYAGIYGTMEWEGNS